MAPGLLIDDNASCGGADQPKPKVYLLDEYHPDAVKKARKLFTLVTSADPEWSQWREDAEFLLVKGSALPAHEIQAATKLRAIGKQGVGIDKIDAEACKAAGVEIINTPGVNSVAVAELVLALTMSVARDIGSIQVRQSRGEVIAKQTCSGLVLTGRRLGLIGMGHIGKYESLERSKSSEYDDADVSRSRQVARMFRGAFGSDVVAYDPFLPADAWNDLPHTRVSTPGEVITAADVLSLHVPLTPTTRDMITYKELSSMKPEAILINAARGGIVNENDLCKALDDGLIWGVGLDCHEEEPPTKERYAALWDHPRMISLPHIGAATSQTQAETALAAVERLHAHILELRRQR